MCVYVAGVVIQCNMLPRGISLIANVSLVLLALTTLAAIQKPTEELKRICLFTDYTIFWSLHQSAMYQRCV